MRIRLLLLAALLCVRAWAQPAPLSGFSDQGTFFLYLNEERVARIDFQWKADGTFQNKAVLSIAGQSTDFITAITPDAEGRWTRATAEDALGKRVFQRKGRDFTMSTPQRSGNGTTPENLVTFEEHSPALLSLALRRYNASRGGRQEFPILVLNSDNPGDPMTLERKETTERAVNGRSLKLTHWVYGMSDCEIEILAGEDGRVYLASGVPSFGYVPAKYARYVREGYEGLIPGAPYELRVERNIKIPMRDGVKLAADLYFPAGLSKAPVVLIRTPYQKEQELQASFYARRGYVSAVQDVRGRFASEGQWELAVNEPKDGYDTIEWLARQPWSTGKVGMIGGSYLGWVQWFAASLRPPHLTTIIPNVSPPDPFHNVPYDHGVLWLAPSLEAIDMIESKATADLSGVAIAKASGKNYDELLKVLPIIDADKAMLGRESATWRHWLAHPTADAYWAAVMFHEKLKDVRIPVFHESGWFDGDSIGSKLNYLKMASYGHTIQKLTMGPWGHTANAQRWSGGRDFGPEADIDLQNDYLRWFDYWLKGIDNGILKEPLVSLFVMGTNRWLRGPTYPLPQTRFEKLYLTSGGGLSFTPPGGTQAPDRYTYNPGDPTPISAFGESAPRPDILVYTTAPFEKPYTIAGPLSAVLSAATSARDTDWFVVLMDIAQDGKASALWSTSSGQLRARYRNSVAKTELLEPGRIYRYNIDLWHTGVTIAAGHRLRVEIASAAFPMFSRNLNTGGNNEIETRFISASQAIYHDARHPSYILLPRVE